MPHIHIDYSPNLEPRLDMAGLCRCLRDAAVATGVFPMAGIRVRATPAAYVVIADDDPRHGYVDVSVRLGAGRALDIRQAASRDIFAAAQTFCAEVMATTPFLLSLEMREIDPDLSHKTSSIREYLPSHLH